MGLVVLSFYGVKSLTIISDLLTYHALHVLTVLMIIAVYAYSAVTDVSTSQQKDAAMSDALNDDDNGAVDQRDMLDNIIRGASVALTITFHRVNNSAPITTRSSCRL